MMKDSKNRLLSDGTKPPAIPQWLLITMGLAGLGFLGFALSKPAYVIAFLVELCRKPAGG